MKRFGGMLSSYTPCFTDIVILGRLLPHAQAVVSTICIIFKSWLGRL